MSFAMTRPCSGRPGQKGCPLPAVRPEDPATCWTALTQAWPDGTKKHLSYASGRPSGSTPASPPSSALGTATGPGRLPGPFSPGICAAGRFRAGPPDTPRPTSPSPMCWRASASPSGPRASLFRCRLPRPTSGNGYSPRPHTSWMPCAMPSEVPRTDCTHANFVQSRAKSGTA